MSSPFINMSNLKVLTDYISDTYGKSHRIILSEQGFSSGNGENLQAAALVHAYYLAATNPMIDAFEIRSYEDEKLEMLQGTTMGLTSRKTGGYAMKEAYTAYKYCDDPRAEAKQFMNDHAYYKVVNSSANGWGDVSNPYYDASTFDSKVYRDVPVTPEEPEQPVEPEEPPTPATFTVSFNTNGGEAAISDQTVTDGETAAKPADPKKTGYTFRHWADPSGAEYDFATPVTGNLTLKAIWEAKTDTAYTIEHYKANVDGTYPSAPSETEKGTGTTDTDTAAAAKTYEGFTAQTVQQQKISGDGKTVVRIYYTRNQVTLHFDSKGGSVVEEIKAPYGSAVTKPADPKRTGYAFKGWDSAVPDKMPAEDLTLTAQWEINTYTVKFDTASGSPAIADQKVEYENKASKPEDPKKTGYVFAQWLDAEGRGYNFDSPVTMDLTLTAQWTAGETGYKVEHYLEKAEKPGEYALDENAVVELRGTTGTKTAATSNTYPGFVSKGVNQTTIAADGSTVVKIYYDRNTVTLKFLGVDGKELTSVSGRYQTAVNAPDTPKRAGYAFAGWNQTVPATFPAEDQTYTATWTANTNTLYTVKHYRADLNGIYTDSLCETETGLTGTTDTQTNAKARTYVGFTAQTPQQEVISGDGSTVVKIYYTRNQTTLHFDANGGSPVADQKAPYDSPVTKPADPKRTGYSFKGWDSAVPDKMPSEDKTLTAQWEINTYTVKFDTTGGSSSIADQKAEYGQKASKPEDPKKQGYTFVQWLNADGKAYDFSSPVTGDLKLTAQWTEGETGYTVEHYLEKKDAPGEFEQDAQATVQMRGTTGAKTEAKAKAYTGFLSGPITQETIAANGSTVVKVYYQRNTVTLKFLGEGGKTVATVSGKYGSKVNAPADPTRKGYSFNGWDADVPASFPADDGEFTATWKADDCIVTFLDEDGRLLSKQVLPYDTPSSGIQVPQTPTKEKDAHYTYTFRAWTPALQNVTGDIAYQAAYDKKENTYTVLFTDGLGKTLDSQEVIYGKEPVKPADPKRTGYAFTGFAPAITAVKGDQTYQATWKPLSYKITYDLAGGENAPENPSAFTVESAEITFATPKRTGYNFEKWVDASGKTVSSLPSGSTEDRKLKAVWTKAITYAINYDLAGGENASGNPAYYTVESGALTLAAPKRTGYIFTGWTGEGITTPAKTVIIPAKSTGERNYTAHWEKNSYTVKFDKADGSNPTTMTVPYGDPITKPSNPTREGYDFEKWSQEIPSVMPAENLTFTAQWKEKTYPVVFVDANGNPLQSETVAYGKETSYKGDAPQVSGKVFIGWSLNGVEDTTKLLQLHEKVGNVKSSCTCKAVYTAAPAENVPIVSAGSNDPAGTKATAESGVTLDREETKALNAFTNDALKPSQVKRADVLAELAAACAKANKANQVQSITNIALEIKTRLTAKTNSGNAAVYTFEISPYAVAKNGSTTIAEAKLDNEALNTSASSAIRVRIPMLGLDTLFAQIVHYNEDNQTIKEIFSSVPVQKDQSTGEKYAEVDLTSFSLFTVEKGQPGTAAVSAGTGASTGTGAANAAASQSAAGNAAGSAASLNGSAIPTPDLTFAQKAAIEMAALQEKAATAGNWVANLFGLGNGNAAGTQTNDAAAQGTADATDAASSDAAGVKEEAVDGTAEGSAAQEGAQALTEDFRTAEAQTGESAQETVQSQASQEAGADQNATGKETNQKTQGIAVKPVIIVVICVLGGAVAAFVICRVVMLKKQAAKRRHKKKRP